MVNSQVENFARARYFFRPQREVSLQYEAHAIPTLVVVDRSGNVSSHTVGLHDEASLRAMLKKAGLP